MYSVTDLSFHIKMKNLLRPRRAPATQLYSFINLMLYLVPLNFHQTFDMISYITSIVIGELDETANDHKKFPIASWWRIQNFRIFLLSMSAHE